MPSSTRLLPCLWAAAVLLLALPTSVAWAAPALTIDPLPDVPSVPAATGGLPPLPAPAPVTPSADRAMDAAAAPSDASPAARSQILAPRPSDRVMVDQLAGGPRRGAWGVSLQAGYPFFALRALIGVRDGLAPLVELDTALGRRFNASLGVSLAWVQRPHLRLSGEVLLGWLLQESELPRRGPSAELRLRLGAPTRWVMPYLILGTRHAVLPSRTRIQRESGSETQWSARHEWTPTGSLGLGIHLHRRVGLDLGADYAWVDAPQSIAIPGFHIGLHVGGGR